MHASIRGIDHLVIAVRDLDRAQSTYQRMGFTLTPRGYHTLGSQNHCLMFGTDYLELLAVPRPHPANQFFIDFLQRREGLAAIAFASDDSQAAQSDFTAAGVAAEAPLEFSRPVERPDGVRDARFRIVALPAAATPGCRAFVCEHLTPELVWVPDSQRHALGVTGIAGIALQAADPQPVVDAWARTLAVAPEPIAEGQLLRTGTAPIAVATPHALAQRLPRVALPEVAEAQVAAIYLRVFDRSACETALRNGGFSVVRLADGACAVGADQAHGVALVFG
ncbi:MAG TPA: VOC family protein [Burkholderiaceae bacterium]|nr:VOC family protein [Burkholderiaceae bacterium]